jgi:hypothetical protein
MKARGYSAWAGILGLKSVNGFKNSEPKDLWH